MLSFSTREICCRFHIKVAVSPNLANDTFALFNLYWPKSFIMFCVIFVQKKKKKK